MVEEQFCLNFLRQGDFVSISINPCIEKKNSFSSQKGMFWDGNVFIYNMIPFILAMKPAFFVIKYGISLLKMFVLLPMWNKSYCKWRTFVPKTDQFISERATSCLFWNFSSVWSFPMTLLSNNTNFLKISFIIAFFN